ncbi:hypothetical protein [Nocardia sp. NPDC020380]|uniref:hypothetical protein n=1 Tax=Nocardia sp. NPDC020380 TaxID=3364309 RepID=UPI0037BB80B7
MKIIGLEEHLVTDRIADAWQAAAGTAPDDPALQFALRGPSPSGLLDLGDERLKAMDEVGMDVQVLSLTTPGLQRLTPAAAVPLQTELPRTGRSHRRRARADRLGQLGALVREHSPVTAHGTP